MARFRSYVARLAAFFHRSRTEAELDEEIRFHLDMETAENRRRGLAPREARRTARLRFGGVEAVKAACRDEARLPWLEILLQDALYALRRMARSPGLTTVAVLTLALGIGATSALWSVIDAVLVEPLPYPHPERLVSVVTRQVDGSWSLNTQSTFDYVRRNASSFEHVAASGWPSGINLAAGSEAEHVAGRRVTADYFAVLGVTPRLGRGFTRDEEQPGGAAVAVLSHGLWLRRFAGDPGVVGRAVTIGGEPHTVVGVMPEGFRPLPPAELWRPLRADFEGSGTKDVATAPRIVGVVGDVRTFGLRRDPWPMMYVPLSQVAGTLFQVHHRWFDSHWLVRLRPGAASPIPGIREAVRSIDPRLPFSGFRTMDEVISGSLVRERFQAVLLATFAALALVMAAAGLFGLLSYGVVQRRREIGVRMALGATWADALRLVVREGLGLAAVGIALGCAGALAFARVLESFVFGVSPTEPAVYAGIAAGFLAVALAASAVPGLKAVRLDPATTLRQE